MTRDLLVRGMVAGVLAALLVTLCARLFAEPYVDGAIAYEAMHEAHGHGAALSPEPEIVSRAMQKGLGLLTAVTLYGAAVGGILSLVFAFLYGRIGAIGPRWLAFLLALGALVAVGLVPALKYPPNPPAVGLHETVALRTGAYFSMIALSLVSLVIAVKLARGLAGRIGAFNGMIAGALGYVLLVAIAQLALPVIDEVPADFPAVLLWKFRITALLLQCLLWSALGLGFGALAERVIRNAAGAPHRR